MEYTFKSAKMDICDFVIVLRQIRMNGYQMQLLLDSVYYNRIVCQIDSQEGLVVLRDHSP